MHMHQGHFQQQVFFPAIHMMHLTLRHLTVLVPCFSAHVESVFRVRNHYGKLCTSNEYQFNRIQLEQAVVCLALGLSDEMGG